MSAQTRKQRIKNWVFGEFEGRISSLISYYKLPHSYHSYINQILSGHRNLGERAARALEEKCGKPEGWLDDDDPLPIRFDIKAVNELPPADKQLIEDFISMVLKKNANRETDNNGT